MKWIITILLISLFGAFIEALGADFFGFGRTWAFFCGTGTGTLNAFVLFVWRGTHNRGKTSWEVTITEVRRGRHGQRQEETSSEEPG